MDGRTGAVFCIYWGEVSDDSDGPLEWCRPVPAQEARALAAEVPELELRGEPAHREAFVHLGPGGQIGPAEWERASESLRAWAAGHAARPSELGARITYLAVAAPTEGGAPDCDFAVPLAGVAPSGSS